MKKILFVTPEDAACGFSLAGVRQLVLSTADLRPRVQMVADDPAIGVLAIDERLVDRAVQQAIDDIERRTPGLVVVLPAPIETERPAEDYALRLIRRAIGYQVRIRL